MRELKFELECLLETMQVPEERKNLNIINNIRWLRINLANVNSDHQYLEEALFLIRRITKKMRY